MTLRRRLLVMIALVLLVSLACGGVLTYWHAVRKIDLEMSSALAVGEVAMRDAIAVTAQPADGFDARFARAVASFNGDRHLRARWTGPDGTLRDASEIRPPPDPAPPWLQRLLAAPPYSMSFPLQSEARNLGRIDIVADPLNEISEVWEDAKLKFLIVGGFCALVLALVYGTLGRALRPLENLAQAFGRVGEGDYSSTVPETGPQDLAVIYKSFNTMAGKLNRAEHQNQRLNEQLSTVQDEERAEIARDLHDEIGPFLFAVDVDAQTLPPLIARGAADEAVSRAQSIRQAVGHMQTHLRSVLGRLRPATLLDLGLKHAVDELVAFWQARQPDLSFQVDIAPELEDVRLPEALEQVAFRVVQEGTSNAVRHGTPRLIALQIAITPQNALRVAVTDDGRGLADTAKRGFGLKGMHERVAMLGGTLSVASGGAGRGVSIAAHIPLSAVGDARRGIRSNHDIAATTAHTTATPGPTLS